MTSALSTAEFFGTPVSIIDHANRRWLTAEEAGHCLGYNEANVSRGIRSLFDRHADEFTEEDACRINLFRQGQNRESLIFSATGCNLLGFFSNTARAKDFRVWAKQFLAGNAVPPAPTLAPEARLDRLDANMAQLAAGMSAVLTQMNVTAKYIGLLELNQAGQRKVTNEVRAECLALKAEGMDNASIGRLLRISRTAVSLIVRDKYHAAPEAPQRPVGEILAAYLEKKRLAAGSELSLLAED